MTESYPSQTLDKFVLRLPDGMRDRIKAAAEANNRSMNAEIVATLEKEYPEVVIVDLGEYLASMLMFTSHALSREPDNSYIKATYKLFSDAQADLDNGRIGDKRQYFHQLLGEWGTITERYPKSATPTTDR